MVGHTCMEKKMGEAVARVAKKVNETVENQADSLDLADCKLMTFPIALYKVMRHVAEGIHLITLANNELKSVTSKFIITFSQLRAVRTSYDCGTEFACTITKKNDHLDPSVLKTVKGTIK
uniref:Leucine-rich repeat-containing protein 20 n=1 Tax=Micrurus corallinus TaxID=54390 RepID=A0A2D4G7Q2_MICCO